MNLSLEYIVFFSLLLFACKDSKEDMSSDKSVLIIEMEGCFQSSKDFDAYLNDYAAIIENDSIYHNSEPLSDCSGIFHKLLLDIKKHCPKSEYPPIQNRSSRQIAKWFHEERELTQVSNIMDHLDEIEIGTIIFYGISGRNYQNNDISILFTREGITHMGVVTKTISRKGKLNEYELFHGRSKGKIAKRTRYHSVKNSPPFSNGRQPVVALSHLNYFLD